MSSASDLVDLVNRNLDDRRVEREFIQAYGSENQHERWAAGLLPESELLSLARWELFAAFASFPRWVKLEGTDLRHARSCPSGGYGSVSFATHKPSTLTHDEWAVFKKITAAVSAANNGPLVRYGVQATAELVEHVGRCNSCDGSLSGRAASIRITWAGRPLSREYTLEGQ